MRALLQFVLIIALGFLVAYSAMIGHNLVARDTPEAKEYEAPVEWHTLFDGMQLRVTNSSIVVEAGATMSDCVLIHMGNSPAIEVREQAWSNTDLLLTIVTPNNVRNLITTR